MKKTLITAVALAACAGTPLFAQNAKEGVITFALTSQAQNSVSTSTASNAGLWSQQPRYYKTVTGKLATSDILQAIAYVLHNKNNNFYGSKAQLVLVQGELSGFFNLNALPSSPNLTDVRPIALTPGLFDITPDFSETTLHSGATFAQLATGRHLEHVPFADPPADTTPLVPTSGAWPVGHHQPWGQIFVKIPTTAGIALCENVTPFFAITVEECYDCFYLSSFITDTTFKYQTGASGLPCCTTPTSLLGNGKDRYYMTLSFDNTLNNPYLNPGAALYVGGWGQATDPTLVTYNAYAGKAGIGFAAGTFPGDGITPDFIKYYDSIQSGAGKFNQFVTRFTLNGTVTYTWSLKMINTGDSVADFVGSASYSANGYGFIALRCALLSGTASIAEKVVKLTTCCLDDPWYSWWYGIGWNQFQDPWGGFVDPTGVGTPYAAPGLFESPINTPADLSFHTGFDEAYEPGEQSGSNPTPWSNNTTIDPSHPTVNVPVGP
jgi:hypothetical protein